MVRQIPMYSVAEDTLQTIVKANSPKNKFFEFVTSYYNSFHN